MAEVWFWLVIMIAATIAVFALIVYVISGGAREFALEMRGPKAEKAAGKKKKKGGEDAPAEAAEEA